MSMQLSQEGYEKLIKEDIDWVKSHGPLNACENGHIVHVLEWSIKAIYEEIPLKDSRIKELEKENKTLRNALIGHRQDLHNYSSRPCATCRESAEALGIGDKVPKSCALPLSMRSHMSREPRKEEN